jgi:hypothetical protein
MGNSAGIGRRDQYDVPPELRYCSYHNLRVALKAAVVRLFFGLMVSMTFCSHAAAQLLSSSTETQALPEVDAHIDLLSTLRILAFTGLAQGTNVSYQQWYTAAALGYRYKPILRPHARNIDPDKEFYFLFGSGYEFLRTTKSGRLTDENRMVVEITAGFRPTEAFLLRDRNRVESRWINGRYSTTYRNQLSLERDFVFQALRFTPYGSAEIFYDGAQNSWNQEWYTAGVQWPYRHLLMLDTFYRRENCSGCAPAHWNVAGLTVHFYFRTPK